MRFTYSDAPQRSPEWFRIRLGRVTASRLSDWLAVSKAKTGPGKPLKARLDYEKELLFERKFGTSFEKFVTEAMQDGVDFEDFARRQYEHITGRKCYEVGCWYNPYFVASPDRAIGDDGLLEIKVLKDSSFTDVLIDGVPDKHWQQIQGQLWASGRKWCDYVAINLNTKKVKIIRVQPDLEFHQWLELAVPEELVSADLDGTDLFDFVEALPAGSAQSFAQRSTSNDETGGW
jgi:hypothetical protein